MQKNSINRVFLVGFLGNNPEGRYTANGRAVANFSIATHETWKQSEGSAAEHTEWHSVVVWDKLADFVVGFLKKGHNVKAINFIKLYPDIFFPGKTQYLEKTNFKESFRLISTYNPFTWSNAIKKIVSFNADAVIFRYWHPILIPSYYYIAKKLKKNNSKLKIYCI